MSEDNVIRPTFGGRKTPQTESLLGAVPQQSDSLDIVQDVQYCLAHLETVWHAHLRGDQMTNYLFDDIKYKKSDPSLVLRRPVVRGYTFEQFCDQLLSSSSTQWRSQPAFYGALFIEFHERQNLILLSLQELAEQIKSLSREDAEIIVKLAMRDQAS